MEAIEQSFSRTFEPVNVKVYSLKRKLYGGVLYCSSVYYVVITKVTTTSESVDNIMVRVHCLPVRRKFIRGDLHDSYYISTVIIKYILDARRPAILGLFKIRP